ncbi:26S protease regulatory subunit 10B [Striga asiatica]|uniref:26S protease regulatory subunit 10B n=1 Tax=Striga asiatica TaxID=4170 RepID=A0A5A7PKX1_STRAF|nr:26S protease regulatory subunit 10B [Striga asiatica]
MDRINLHISKKLWRIEIVMLLRGLRLSRRSYLTMLRSLSWIAAEIFLGHWVWKRIWWMALRYKLEMLKDPLRALLILLHLRTRSQPRPRGSAQGFHKWEDRELPCYVTSFITIVILGVGLNAKTDHTRNPSSWNLPSLLSPIEVARKVLLTLPNQCGSLRNIVIPADKTSAQPESRLYGEQNMDAGSTGVKGSTIRKICSSAQPESRLYGEQNIDVGSTEVEAQQ